MKSWIAGFAFLASAAFADGGDLLTSDVIFLGEQHDNPAHHARQAEIVEQVQPTALIFEMLTPAQAAKIMPGHIPDENTLAQTLEWEQSGWPDFAMYYPIFTAAPDATVFGAAVPRQQARRVMSEGIVPVFGANADLFGLTEPLPAAQQAARETLQMQAHCNAMPEEMLPMMVDIQRLRDAMLAASALEAFNVHGGPVVVITGNGHARKDWGAPAALTRVAPDLSIAALGQGETAFGAPEGQFDMTEITQDVDRGDPCAAFAKD